MGLHTWDYTFGITHKQFFTELANIRVPGAQPEATIGWFPALWLQALRGEFLFMSSSFESRPTFASRINRAKSGSQAPVNFCSSAWRSWWRPLSAPRNPQFECSKLCSSLWQGIYGRGELQKGLNPQLKSGVQPKILFAEFSLLWVV